MLSGKSKKGIFLFLLLFVSIVYSQDKISPVEKQARELMKYFANPAGAEKLFTKDFLKQVPPDRMAGILKYYYSACGAPVKIEPVKITSGFSAKYDYFFEKNSTVAVTINVEQKEPYLISGLFFGNPVIFAADFNEFIEQLKKLPGETSLLAAKLDKDKLVTVAEHNPDKHLAIGSSFKLYILSELLRTINLGQRKWSDVIKLNEECRSLPSGFLHDWHTGTYMTLESLASLMISISDNTATDNLLRTAGRENVEKIQKTAGHSNPQLNIPFLATMDMFKLKGGPDKGTIEKYLASSDRKKFLKEELAKIKRDDFVMWDAPFYIDKVEWFASARDLCNVMNWIKKNSDKEKDSRTRNILSINPGTTISKDKWKYIGYKGGSEPGVMNMTYLLQSAAGDWYVLSCGWNNPKASLDEAKFAGMVSRAIQLLEK